MHSIASLCNQLIQFSHSRFRPIATPPPLMRDVDVQVVDNELPRRFAIRVVESLEFRV